MTVIDAEMLERLRREATERVGKIGDEIRFLRRQREQCKGVVSLTDHLLAVLDGPPARMTEPDDSAVTVMQAPAGAEEDAAAMSAVEGEPGDNAGTDGF